MTVAREEMACKVCLAPLNVIGYPPTYIHPLSLDTDGHVPVPVPSRQFDTLARRCDFCGDPYPVWAITGGDVNAVLDSGNSTYVQRLGSLWASCGTCQSLIDDGRTDKVIDRGCASLGTADQELVREHVARLHEEFHAQRRPGRTVVTTTLWPASPLTATDLPKVRDRLRRFLYGSDERPDVLAIAQPRPRQTVADGIERARLFWIDEDFTHLAEHAAGQLPDVTIIGDDMPSADGLMVWSRPVTSQRITAMSWTADAKGWQLVGYRTIGGGLSDRPLQHVREQVGWLVPVSATRLRDHQTFAGGDHPVAALAATWLLIAQKVAETATAEVDKAVRKKYARTGRPLPDVRIVRIRAHTTGTAAASPKKQEGERRPLTSRFWVSAHWRQQAYGRDRALRRLIYINPLLRGPADAPINLSTTVRVLASAPKPHPGPEQR